MRHPELKVQNWVEDHPEGFGSESFKVDRWIGRQVFVPHGYIDLLGIASYAGMVFPVVAEVKRAVIDGRALSQVSRYAYFISEALMSHAVSIQDFAVLSELDKVYCLKIVVGAVSPTVQVCMEAEALDVSIFTIEGHPRETHRWTINQDNERYKRQKDILKQYAGKIYGKFNLAGCK